MKPTQKLVLSAMFLALGLVLPFFTGQLPQLGNFFLPMHFTIFLATYICGWQCGAEIGFILPLLRSFMFGAPIIYPNAIAISVELLSYGLIAGLIYKAIKFKKFSVYASMIIAMIGGRIIWGFMQMLLLGIKTEVFTFNMFITAAFLNAIPGIIIQLLLIPPIVLLIKRKFNYE